MVKLRHTQHQNLQTLSLNSLTRTTKVTTRNEFQNGKSFTLLRAQPLTALYRKKEAAAAAANGATRSPLMPVSNLNQPAVISPSLDEMMADEMMADFVDYDAPMDTVDPRALLFADDDPVENQPSVTPFASMSISSPTAPPTPKPSPTASPTPIPSPTAPPAPKPPNPTPPTPTPPSTAPARTEAVLRTSGRRSNSKPDYDMRSHPLDPYLRTQSSAGGQPSDKSNSEGSSGLSDSEQSQSTLVKPTRGLAHQVSEACHCCIQLS